jgi:subtilisin family serine protease
VRYGEPTLTAPSDADSILAVGSVTAGGARCSYSGTGPSYDGRVKPEISSIGCSMPVVNPGTSTGVYNQSGTSFAAPVVAGVAALLVQLHSDSTVAAAQRIRRVLMASGASASNPDDQVGNGLLRAAAAHELLGPRGLKGALAWRARGVTLPWRNVDPSRARLWDGLGRERRVRVEFTPDGNLKITPESENLAQGAYLLRIPKAKE